jgi:hypothetical protein
VGILLPHSSDFRCFPTRTGPYFSTWVGIEIQSSSIQVQKERRNWRRYLITVRIRCCYSYHGNDRNWLIFCLVNRRFSIGLCDMGHIFLMLFNENY